MSNVPGDGSSLPVDICAETGRRILYENVLHAFFDEDKFSRKQQEEESKGRVGGRTCQICGAPESDVTLVNRPIGSVCRAQFTLTSRNPKLAADGEDQLLADGSESSARGIGIIVAGPNVEAPMMRVNWRYQRLPATNLDHASNRHQSVLDMLRQASRMRPPFVVMSLRKQMNGAARMTRDPSVLQISNGLEIGNDVFTDVDMKAIDALEEGLTGVAHQDLMTFLDWRDGRKAPRNNELKRITAAIEKTPGGTRQAWDVVRGTPEFELFQLALKQKERQDDRV